ncbi:flagellar hook-basal body complex protein [Azonexus hydrophilus]|uniref:Flagellar hook protein FlgE n=1 Tax=Azonexus hydrophilus TaxID=418702 RepID=A0ABZ2XIU9_9RHOO
MAFQQALSGLNVAGKAIDVTSHNIANASTVGFKAGSAHFADVYAASLNGAGASQIGIGVNLAAVQQQFTQGNITATNNPLDISINGSGFFRMDTNGAVTFTRSGQFHLDRSGYIINDQNMRLTGYPAQAGIIVPSTPQPLQISASDLAPVATGTNVASTFRGVKANLQLDSRAKEPEVPWTNAAIPTGATVATNVTANGGSAAEAAAALAAYDAAIAGAQTQAQAAQAAYDAVIGAGGTVLEATAARTAGLAGANYSPDPQSYSYSTALSIFDTLGNAHTLTMFFEKTNASGEWNVHFTLDGTSNNYITVTPGNALTFNTLGQIASGNPMSLQIDLNNVMGALGTTNGADPVMNFDIDFTGTTQFGSSFGTNRLEQDGYTAGNLIGLSVGNDGVILGRYSNGQTFAQGQVVLANFTNPNGLQSLGNNQWSETSASGPALVGAPNTSSLGVLSSSTVEESNVDLTSELVSLITNQRNYQANAQSIKTQDQVLQTLVNLR